MRARCALASISEPTKQPSEVQRLLATLLLPDRAEEFSMLSKLDRTQRLRLLRFVCSFAWADLEVQPEERRFIADLMGRLDFDENERQRVAQWLELPPNPEEVDPTAVPHAHRQVFVDSIKGVIAADGEITFEERSALELFDLLLSGE